MSYGGSGRGQYRGYKTASWRNIHTYRERTNRVLSPEDPETLFGPRGELMGTINLADLDSTTKDLTIANTKHLASYNWVDGESPTVLMPGAPPLWTPPTFPISLQEDSGQYFRDANAARAPKHPLEPAVRAIMSQAHEFDFKSLDIVACGSTMGNLLRFADSIEMSFRFDVEMVGSTILFIRRGKSPLEMLEDVRGYGHTFPEACTQWEPDVKGSCSHQRVVNYTFGELNCLVRFQSDGYLRDKAPANLHKPESAQSGSVESSEIVSEELSALLNSATSITATAKLTSESRSLCIKSAGRYIPQSAIFDIKTRSAKRPINMTEVLRRLWVTQVPNFIIAYHNSGTFEDCEVKDVESQLKSWESENSPLLSRLQNLLRSIISRVSQSDDKKLEISRIGYGPLYIRRQIGELRNVLPDELHAKWSELCGHSSNTIIESDENA